MWAGHPILADVPTTILAVCAVLGCAGGAFAASWKGVTWWYRDRHKRDDRDQERAQWERERLEFERDVGWVLNGFPGDALNPARPGLLQMWADLSRQVNEQNAANETRFDWLEGHTQHPPGQAPRLREVVKR